MSKSTSDMPALFSSSSPKLKEHLLISDSSQASDKNGQVLLPDFQHTHSEVLHSIPSCSSTEFLTDKSSFTENTVSPPVCDIDSSLKDSNSAVVIIQNCVPKCSTVSAVSNIGADSQNSSSLHTNVDATKHYSDAVNSKLCISVDLAVESGDLSATVVSPSDDFQSIYTLNSSSLTASAVTDRTFVPESKTSHSYPDSDSLDAWLEFPLPGKSTVLSLCVSRRTAWYVDKSERLYWSSLKGPGLSWTCVDQPAQQISSSPSGFIVWKVYRGLAYSAVGKLTGKYPAGTEWREVANEVAYVAADDSVVW